MTRNLPDSVIFRIAAFLDDIIDLACVLCEADVEDDKEKHQDGNQRHGDGQGKHGDCERSQDEKRHLWLPSKGVLTRYLQVLTELNTRKCRCGARHTRACTAICPCTKLFASSGVCGSPRMCACTSVCACTEKVSVKITLSEENMNRHVVKRDLRNFPRPRGFEEVQDFYGMIEFAESFIKALKRSVCVDAHTPIVDAHMLAVNAHTLGVDAQTSRSEDCVCSLLASPRDPLMSSSNASSVSYYGDDPSTMYAYIGLNTKSDQPRVNTHRDLRETHRDMRETRVSRRRDIGVDLVILTSNVCTRITYPALCPMLSRLRYCLSSLSVITPPTTDSFSQSTLGESGLYIWEDRNKSWSSVESTASSLWSDYQPLELPRLRTLHISGAVSRLWIGALYNFEAENLHSVWLQCWIPTESVEQREGLGTQKQGSAQRQGYRTPDRASLSPAAGSPIVGSQIRRGTRSSHTARRPDLETQHDLVRRSTDRADTAARADLNRRHDLGRHDLGRDGETGGREESMSAWMRSRQMTLSSLIFNLANTCKNLRDVHLLLPDVRGELQASNLLYVSAQFVLEFYRSISATNYLRQETVHIWLSPLSVSSWDFAHSLGFFCRSKSYRDKYVANTRPHEGDMRRHDGDMRRHEGDIILNEGDESPPRPRAASPLVQPATFTHCEEQVKKTHTDTHTYTHTYTHTDTHTYTHTDSHTPSHVASSLPPSQSHMYAQRNTQPDTVREAGTRRVDTRSVDTRRVDTRRVNTGGVTATAYVSDRIFAVECREALKRHMHISRKVARAVRAATQPLSLSNSSDDSDGSDDHSYGNPRRGITRVRGEITSLRGENTTLRGEVRNLRAASRGRYDENVIIPVNNGRVRDAIDSETGAVTGERDGDGETGGDGEETGSEAEEAGMEMGQGDICRLHAVSLTSLGEATRCEVKSRNAEGSARRSMHAHGVKAHRVNAHGEVKCGGEFEMRASYRHKWQSSVDAWTRLVDLWKNISLKPDLLDFRYEQHVSDILRNEVEGKCLGKLGFVVCVIRTLQRERGRAQDGSGNVIVAVKYQAVIFQPLKGEVLDGVITSANAVGVFAQCGPLKAFVSKANFPPEYELIEGVWTDGDLPFAVDTEVRLRILGFKYEVNGMTAVAQMDQDYLGRYT